MPHAYNLGDQFAWNGPQGKGGMKVRREVKRAEAEARTAAAGPVQGCTSCFSRHDVDRDCPLTVEQRTERAA